MWKFLTTLMIGALVASSAQATEVSTLSAEQVLAALQGCWVIDEKDAETSQRLKRETCFRDGGEMPVNIWLTTEGFGGLQTYDVRGDRLHIHSEGNYEANLWDGMEVDSDCSVLFASRKIFAVYDCSGNIPDTRFRRMDEKQFFKY